MTSLGQLEDLVSTFSQILFNYISNEFRCTTLPKMLLMLFIPILNEFKCRLYFT